MIFTQPGFSLHAMVFFAFFVQFFVLGMDGGYAWVNFEFLHFGRFGILALFGHFLGTFLGSVAIWAFLKY